MSQLQNQLERVLADKEAFRRQARAKSWPEKVATIERLRDATRLAREAMQKRKAAPSPYSTNQAGLGASGRSASATTHSRTPSRLMLPSRAGLE